VLAATLGRGLPPVARASMLALVCAPLLNACTAVALRGNPAARAAVFDLLIPCVTLLAGAGLYLAARAGPRRGLHWNRAWLLFTLALALQEAGAVLWAVLDLWFRVAPSPSPADILFVLSYPLFFAGVFSLPADRRSRADTALVLIDVSMIVAAATAVAWAFFLAPLLRPHGLAGDVGGDLAAQAVAIAYPICDLGLIWAALSSIWRRLDVRDRLPAYLLLAALCAECLGDTIFPYLITHGAYSAGQLSDVPFTAATALIGLAGWVRLGEERRQPPGEHASPPVLVTMISAAPPWAAAVPYVSAAAAYLALVVGYGWLGIGSFPAIALGIGALTTLALVRQALTARENRQLCAQLQHDAEQRQRVTERLEELDRLKSQFVSNVSHELRTPLANIILYLDLLEDGKPARHGHYMATLKREAQLLQRLIADLLDLSRLDLDRAEIQLCPLDVGALATALVADRAALIEAGGLRLSIQTQPGLPLVLGDQKMLTQVLTNLIGNAANYTPAGGAIRVQAACAAGDGHPAEDEIPFARVSSVPSKCCTPAGPGEWVRLSVADTGPGIPPGEQEHIFERFYRGEAARRTGAAGTGLGLAICQEIVQRHGGKITVQSAPGCGSEFTAWLPVAQL